MTKNERVSPSERGINLYETSEAASRMIAERIILEDLGLNLVQLPLCTEHEADLIEEFIPKAKDGFALSLNSGRVFPDEICRLLKSTTPIAIGNQFNRIKLIERENTLPEYRHVLAVLAYLLKIKNVSFCDFTDPPKGINGDLALAETTWCFNTFSVDHIWSLMTDIENLTRATLYQKGTIGVLGLLKVGHFFSASKEISSIFS